MKALDFLKEQQRRHKNMAESMNLVYFDDELEEAIAELEALQSRSCEGCIHRSELHEGLTNGVTNGFCVENGFFTRRGFCCNRYEAKEQL